MSKTAVRIEALAAVLAVSSDTVARRLARGELPSPDFRARNRLGWRLSTLRTWRPDVAARCTALVAVLDAIPLKPAA
jgi:predicted DNA-binding transcriptional regulator AlpA